MSVRRTRADRQAAISSGLVRHVVGANRVATHRAAKQAARAPVGAKVPEVATIAPVAPVAAPADAAAPAKKRINWRELAQAAKRVGKGRGDNKSALLTGTWLTPWQPPKGVLPRGQQVNSRLAMDLLPEGLIEGNLGAGGWAGDALNVSFAEGIGFLGYSYLAALTQRAEYRKISERFATEMTRKWIRFQTVNKPEEYQAPGPDKEPGTPAGAMGVPADPQEADASSAVDDAEATRERVQQSIARKRQLDKTKRIKELEDEMRRLRVKDAFYTIAEGDGWFGRFHLYLDFGADDDEDKTPVGNGLGLVSEMKIGLDKRPAGRLVRGAPPRKRKLVAVRPIEPMWCYPANYNSLNPRKPDWYNPEIWYVNGASVHRSRLLRFVGREVPDILKPAYAFGGLSMSQMAKPYVDNWLRTRQAVCNLIESFSVSGVYTNMAGTLEEGSDEAFARMEVFNILRSNAGAMVLDKDTEEFFNVSTPLGTLDALQAQSQEQMSSVSGIPLIILLGITPKGLNASSEGELRAFYDTVHAFQEQFFRDHLQTVIYFIMLSLWGEVDHEIMFEFVPLWSMTDKELAEVRKTEAETDGLLIDKGIITNAEARNRVANDPDSQYHDINPADVPEMPEQDTGDGDDDPFGGGDDDDSGGGGDEGGEAKGGFASDEWNETDHPRDHGQFASGSGSGASSPALKISSLKKSGGRLGSNEGGTYTDESGNRFYVKKPASQAHVANEKTAAKLYQLAGVQTLKYREAGPDHVVTEWQDLDKNRIAHMTPEEKKAAATDFAVHAWLSNWDAAGTGGDNQGIRGGKPVTLDVGGSLRYRAQGGEKGKAFGDQVLELNTLRDKSLSPDAAGLFGKMTDKEIRTSIQRVTSIPDAKIREAVGDDKELADRLIARKKHMAKRMGAIASDEQLDDEAMMAAALDAVGANLDDDDLERTAEEEIDEFEAPEADLANDEDPEEVAPDVFVLAMDDKSFDESKIKRDPEGKFATTGAAGGKEGEEAEGAEEANAGKTAFKSKKEHIAHLLTEGTTPKELMTAMGWPSVSMPAQAQSLGMKLEKKDGKYFGTKMSAEELAQFKADAAAKKAAKQDDITKKVASGAMLSSQQVDEHLEQKSKGFDWSTATTLPGGPPGTFEQFKEYVDNAALAGNDKLAESLKKYNPAWAKQLNSPAAAPAKVELPAGPAAGEQPNSYPQFLGALVDAAKGDDPKTKVKALFAAHPDFAGQYKDNAAPAMVAKLEKQVPGIFDQKKSKAPEASSADKQKAIKSTPVQPHLVPGDKPETETMKGKMSAAIDAFNSEWAGKDNLSSEQLNAKVQDFKDLSGYQDTLVKAEGKQKKEILKAEQQKAAWELQQKQEKEKAELADQFAKNPDMKTHYEAMEALFGGKSTGAAYLKTAEQKVASSKLGKHINAHEAVPIIAYSGSHYISVNEQLRKGVMSVSQYKFQKSLNAALDKLPAHDGVTYRKASISKEDLALYQPGMVVEERGFTSSSKSQGVWSGDVQYTIHGKSGRDISKLSSHSGEQEVLFKSGSRFYVESAKDNQIVLREL